MMFKQIKVTAAPGRTRPDVLALFVYEGTTTPPTGARSLDRAMGGRIAEAMKRPEYAAGAGGCTCVYASDKHAPAPRVILVGLGKAQTLTPRAVCLASAALCRALIASKARHVQVEFGELVNGNGLDAAQAGAGLAHGLSSASFVFDHYQGAAGRTKRRPLPALTVRVPRAALEACRAGLIAGASANTARELAATPPNVAHPAYLASRCRKIARDHGLRCKVIHAKQAHALGMGGLLGVGQGSATPPCMIVLEWKGTKQPSQNAAPILVVGKAVTFDTGGYSLKVGGSMKGMKYDKCGGTAVIGIMEAVAKLKTRQRVVGIVACAENMIDREAYRVDDILTISNGVTVEVTNTDAEGRLVLADGLAYGTKTYKPKAVFDLATLTGGVVVALGNEVAGGWCPDDALWRRVEDAAGRSGERVWRMPVDESYRAMMKAQHADLHNSAPVRAAHPIQGAAFLSYFVGENAPKRMPDVPWCHLDIAGTATSDESNALHDRGPTGFGVRLLADLIARW